MNETTLSICFSIQRRSRLELANKRIVELFPNCLQSLVESTVDPDSVEVVICDFDSSDWPLEEWVGDVLDQISFKIITCDQTFHRGLGRNIAAENSNGKNLLFLDADLLLSDDFMNNGLNHLANGEIYYPICFYFLNPKHTLGFWADGAKGIVFIPRQTYELAGKWPCPPNYELHRDEDQIFFRNVSKLGLPIVQKREEGYFHQYHPGHSVNVILKRRRNLIRAVVKGEIIEEE